MHFEGPERSHGPWLPVRDAALSVIPIPVKVPIGLSGKFRDWDSRCASNPAKPKKKQGIRKIFVRIRRISFKLQTSRFNKSQVHPKNLPCKNIPIFPGFNQQILVKKTQKRRSWHLEILHWSPARWQGYDEHRSCQTRVVMPGSPRELRSWSSKWGKDLVPYTPEI